MIAIKQQAKTSNHIIIPNYYSYDNLYHIVMAREKLISVDKNHWKNQGICNYLNIRSLKVKD